MLWPNPQEYNEAIQSPSICFRDPQLRNAEVRTNTFGLPRPTTGAFASVYKLSRGNQSWAIRLFHKDVPDQKARYASTTEFLDNIKLPFFASFRYEESAMQVRGQWLPMLKMDWVDGITLDEYLDSNATNPQKMRQLAGAFREVVAAMRSHGIAHGDLQHGNIMITEHGLMLVDYDGMYVPSMLGWQSTELGHKNYQHPYRSIEHFGDYTDNFSAWLIHTSLMMIAADPDLWSWGKDRECIMFTHADLIKPEESRLFEALSQHPQRAIQDAARLLIRLTNCPLELIPPLGANSEQLQDLPQMDFMQQMLLKEKIEQEDSSRRVGFDASALETLSVRQQMPGQRIGRLWQGFSKAKDTLIIKAVTQIKSTADTKTMVGWGNDLVKRGKYAEAIPIYLQALEQVNKKAKKRALPPESQPWEVKQQLNELNLQLGKAHVLNGDTNKAIVYFKSVHRGTGLLEQAMEASAALLVVYCDLNRMREAESLVKSEPLQELSVATVQMVRTGLSDLPGWSTAMKLIGEHLENGSYWQLSCSIYECILSCPRILEESRSGNLSDTTLTVLIHLSRCHLYANRPNIAARCLQSLINGQDTFNRDLLERAFLILAVAQKQMGSRQDVLIVLSRCKPKNLFRIIRQELRTPLGLMPELAGVVNEYALQLGESGNSEDARLAVRLSADLYRNADHQEQAQSVSLLLKEGKFKEADELAETMDALAMESVAEQLRRSANRYATSLINDDKISEAFHWLGKYECSVADPVAAIEERVRVNLRTASREGWQGAAFDRVLVLMTELDVRRLISPGLRHLVVSTLLSEPFHAKGLPAAARKIADFFEQGTANGASNPDIVRLRKLASSSEQTQTTTQTSRTQQTSLLSRRSAEKVPKAKFEIEMLVIEKLDAFKKTGEPHLLEEVVNSLRTMQSESQLHFRLCDRVATSLEKFFVFDWIAPSRPLKPGDKQRVSKAIEDIMLLSAKVPGTTSAIAQKLYHCQRIYASWKF